ncbi:LOW QUALITY PROTEIN: hypothetical protein OSB04_031477 [Centaurea solstitialis]|uniref:BED-type domain-containing protein n=1 Tax=Centaurea solstitialis TaxID=347529 RepID=A0AA38W613_9ASTR|nr:LOW QUALITY PROTEIN: hypothetical protein OSB04_031477 [Centaurea solstitialis]
MDQGDVSSAPPEQKKSKSYESKSKYWAHCDKVLHDDGRAKCKYCQKEYAVDPKKHGTTTLRKHLDACLQNPHAKETKKSVLAFQALQFNNSGDVLGTWVFNQDKVRKAVTRMIIFDELPFKFVEGRGFKGLLRTHVLCSRYRLDGLGMAMGRFRVRGFPSGSGIFAIPKMDERKNLKKNFKENTQRMSITTDTWTSVQRINYMCITAHFIDAEWKLHKKIISFVPIQSQKGESIAKALEICLLDWGVKNIVTITVDNASSNDVAVGLMKSKLMSWGCSAIRDSYVHMRCIAHILNLVVQDGLKMAHLSVTKLRDIVRWVRGSPAREICDWLDIQEKCSLCLDVPTRWNSTYMMLQNAITYQSAFESYPDRDTSYKADLGDSLLVDSDWIYLESFVVILRSFYQLLNLYEFMFISLN